VSEPCLHAEGADPTPTPEPEDACKECLEEGTQWVHLRVCCDCGHVGCCDSSVGHHATRHFESSGHPVMRSYEPGEDWWWCYVDELSFDIDGAPSAPSHA
jgi:uncharacterized UBP type Zn finger protein